MHDLPPLPATPTSTKARTVSSSPKTPLPPSPTPHQPRYSHPYGIKSTSSGVLSSAAGSSSPNNAISAHSYQQHKSSRSVHSLLRKCSSADELDQVAESGEGSPTQRDKRRNRNEGVLSPMKYDSVNARKRTLAHRASMSDMSGIIQVNHGAAELNALASPRKRVTELREEWSRVRLVTGQGGRNGGTLSGSQNWRDVLPADPKQWTTAQLVIFVHSCLTPYPNHAEASKNTPERDGEGVCDGVSRTDQRYNIGLHPMIVEDIKSWIRRNRIDGKAFIFESDKDWAGSEVPPPFLPIMLSLSAQLCNLTWARGMSRQIASIPDDGKSPFRHYSNTSTSGQDGRNILLETNDNENPDACPVKPFEATVMQPHVREVAKLINRGMHDGAFSPLFPDNRHEIFSQQARFKSRTLSSSSSLSAASIYSSDISEGACVSERAALFESGDVARRRHQTAEEREGRVLERDSPLDSLSTVPTGSSGQGPIEEDVFGSTIRPSMVSCVSGSSRLTSVPAVATSLELVTTHLELAAIDPIRLHGPADISKLSDGSVPRIPDVDGSHFAGFCAGIGLADAADVDNTSGDPDSLSPSKSTSSGCESTEGQGPQTPSVSVPLEQKAQPAAYMSHMMAHERASRKPYGALKRVCSTRVPRSSEEQRRKVITAEHALMPVVGLRIASPQSQASPRSDLEIRVFSQSVLRQPDDPHGGKATPTLIEGRADDASRMRGCITPDLSVIGSPAAGPSGSLCDRDLLTEMAKRLGAAETRITELERLLANGVNDRVSSQRQAAPPQGKSTKPLDAEEDPSGHDTSSPTVFWRWLTAPQSLSSSASGFGPPAPFIQLPGYVVLVGIGLSVIVARVILSRSMTRGR